MPEPKRPQDHKSKADTSADDYFTFTAGGQTYTMPHKTADKIDFKFVRHNRRREEIDYVLTALEELSDGDPDIEKALDSLTRAESNTMLKAFTEHLGAALGE